MGIPSEVVYRYNGDPASDELEVHADLNVALPAAHSVIERNGKSWQVSKVEVIPGTSDLTPIPVYRVSLTEKPALVAAN